MSFLAEILVHTSFFGAFLTGFYFLFVTYIQTQSLDSDFVHSIYGEYLGVDYDRFIPYLIKGVNEVSDEITELKRKVKQLETKLNELQN